MPTRDAPRAPLRSNTNQTNNHPTGRGWFFITRIANTNPVGAGIARPCPILHFVRNPPVPTGDKVCADKVMPDKGGNAPFLRHSRESGNPPADLQVSEGIPRQARNDGGCTFCIMRTVWIVGICWARGLKPARPSCVVPIGCVCILSPVGTRGLWTKCSIGQGRAMPAPTSSVNLECLL
jgi:hypothetical protein